MENGCFLDARMNELDQSEQLPHLHVLLGRRRRNSYPQTVNVAPGHARRIIPTGDHSCRHLEEIQIVSPNSFAGFNRGQRVHSRVSTRN
jgi:hypothetical protein